MIIAAMNAIQAIMIAYRSLKKSGLQGAIILNFVNAMRFI